MSNLCGCRGFTGSSACILERGHEGDHSYGNYLEAVVREDRTEKESLRQQLASREAEIAELKKDATDFHGQVNRLTEWNNNLVSHRDELLAECDQLRQQLNDWIAANSPNGWIDELRHQLAASQDKQWELIAEKSPALVEARQQLTDSQKQVKMLRDEVIRCRDWFETQAKVTSKGGPSSWELMLLRDERDAAEEALAIVEHQSPLDNPVKR